MKKVPKTQSSKERVFETLNGGIFITWYEINAGLFPLQV